MIHDLFSKRQRRLRGEMPDVFQYDSLPIDLKKQLGMLIEEALGSSDTPSSFMAAHAYARIVHALAEEWARPDLLPHRFERYFERFLIDLFVNEPDVERSLDVIELVFRCANREAGNPEYYLRIP